MIDSFIEAPLDRLEAFWFLCVPLALIYVIAFATCLTLDRVEGRRRDRDRLPRDGAS